MIDVKLAMSDSLDAMGLRMVEGTGVRPFNNPKEVLLAICRLSHTSHGVPPQYAIDIYRMIRTLMEHGLTGWQSPSSEDPA